MRGESGVGGGAELGFVAFLCGDSFFRRYIELLCVLIKTEQKAAKEAVGFCPNECFEAQRVRFSSTWWSANVLQT